MVRRKKTASDDAVQRNNLLFLLMEGREPLLQLQYMSNLQRDASNGREQEVLETNVLDIL
jgi:hypothetical protein